MEAGSMLGADAVVFFQVNEVLNQVAIAVTSKTGPAGDSGPGEVLRLRLRGAERLWLTQAQGLDAGEQLFALAMEAPAGAMEGDQGRPVHFALEQNYPNPFNAATSLRYQLPEAVQVRLMVYDMLGRPVRQLVGGWQAAGYYRVVWDGRDERGREVASGVYLSRLEADAFVQVRRLVLLR